MNVANENMAYIMMMIKISLNEQDQISMVFRRSKSTTRYVYSKTLKNLLTEEAGKIIKISFDDIQNKNFGIELVPTRDQHWLMIKNLKEGSAAYNKYKSVLKQGMMLRTLNGESCKYLQLS